MTAATLVVFPVLAGIIGSAVAVVRTPPAAVVSGVQHFAAGVVLAAVAGEVLPELRDRGMLGLVVLGFTLGVALPLALSRYEGGDSEVPGKPPVSFVAVVAVDLFVDGLLVGTGAAVSTETATVITIALTVEILFLGLAVALQLIGSGVARWRAATITGALCLLVAVGAVLGAFLLAGASAVAVTFVLAFAAAALLWLVVEELLVEAHEVPERPWMAAMFFVGFIALFCLEAMG